MEEEIKDQRGDCTISSKWQKQDLNPSHCPDLLSIHEALLIILDTGDASSLPSRTSEFNFPEEIKSRWSNLLFDGSYLILTSLPWNSNCALKHILKVSLPVGMFPDNSHHPASIVANFNYMSSQVWIPSAVCAQGTCVGRAFPWKGYSSVCLRFLFASLELPIPVQEASTGNATMCFLFYIALGPDRCGPTSFFIFSYYFLRTDFVSNNSFQTL